MKYLLALALLFPVLASAWEYQLTPTTAVPASVAKTSAANLGRYVISHEGLTQGFPKLTGYDIPALERVINGGIKICYGPEASLRYSRDKPEAPFACVEDYMSLSNTVRKYGTAKKYNLKLNPPLNEATFANKIDSIVID